MSQIEEVIGSDTETTLISEREVIPELVCLAYDDGTGYNVLSARDEMCETTAEVLMDPEAPDVCFHNASFDLAVIFRAYPHLAPSIFQSLENGRIRCTQLREKMIHLADHGNIDYVPIRPGSDALKSAQYNLAALAKDRLGIDLGSVKTDEDSWRMNFAALKDLCVADWPIEAIQYAGDDTTICRNLFIDQRGRAYRLQQELDGNDPLASENLKVAVDFSLSLATAWGMGTRSKALHRLAKEVEAARDPMRKNEDGTLHWKWLFTTDLWKYIREETTKSLNVSTTQVLITKPIPPTPYANGGKEHEEDCQGHKEHPEFKKGKKIECMCPVKMKAAVKEKKSRNTLTDYVACLAVDNPDIELEYNDPTPKMLEEGQTQGNIKTDKEWMETYAYFDDALAQFYERGKLDKLVTSYIPKFYVKDEEGNPTKEVVDRIHFDFDALKRTGRTSSKESKLYPSMNGQQLDPRVRKALGGDGVIGSWDFKAMELCTVAQRCMDLFGFSKMGDIINADGDCHGYLGASIASEFNEGFGSDFRSISGDPEALYEVFMELKGIDDKCPWDWHGKPDDARVTDFFKHFRKMAKPTGLGYPGGLGHKTFRAFAKATYGVDVDEDGAKRLKDIWLGVYPEMPLLFDYINKHMIDLRNGKKITTNPDGTSRASNRYMYMTPLGLIRSGCNYCAAANGSGMQSPSAEGATMGFFYLTWATHVAGLSDVLAPDENGYKVKFVDFIHDEYLGYIREDGPAAMDAYSKEVCRIAEEKFQVVTPDIKAVVEPALMRTCWIKAAEAEYNEDGHLIPWDDVPKNMELAKKKGWV